MAWGREWKGSGEGKYAAQPGPYWVFWVFFVTLSNAAITLEIRVRKKNAKRGRSDRERLRGIYGKNGKKNGSVKRV